MSFLIAAYLSLCQYKLRCLSISRGVGSLITDAFAATLHSTSHADNMMALFGYLQLTGNHKDALRKKKQTWCWGKKSRFVLVEGWHLSPVRCHQLGTWTRQGGTFQWFQCRCSICLQWADPGFFGKFACPRMLRWVCSSGIASEPSLTLLGLWFLCMSWWELALNLYCAELISC